MVGASPGESFGGAFHFVSIVPLLPNRVSPRHLVLAAATLTYVASAPRGIVGGDNGEFAVLFAHAGVAHPSGYPLYSLWLRVWSWLPVSSPAHGAALATVILGIASVALVGRCARLWGACETSAAVSVRT